VPGRLRRGDDEPVHRDQEVERDSDHEDPCQRSSKDAGPLAFGKDGATLGTLPVCHYGVSAHAVTPFRRFWTSDSKIESAKVTRPRMIAMAEPRLMFPPSVVAWKIAMFGV